MEKIAPHHVECKFLKINAEKSPFFVEKLGVRILPSLVGFRNGIAMEEKIVGFEGLTDGLTFGCESEFSTSSVKQQPFKVQINHNVLFFVAGSSPSTYASDYVWR